VSGRASTIAGAGRPLDVARLLPCVLVAACGWLVPAPDGVSAAGWALLAVFAAVIIGFLLRPLPMGPMVVLGLLAAATTGTLPFEACLTGYGRPVVWLVVGAFMIAGAVASTGLGTRVALMLVAAWGRSLLGLGYAQCAAELLLGPVVPSNTARGGGILAPICASLCRALDSHPGRGPERAGTYLTLVGAHANLVTAAMFLTGMAANGLVAAAALDVYGVRFDWGTWALGALVPGLVSLALLPWLLARLAPPTLTDGRPAQRRARAELSALGPWSRDERIMAGVFVLLLVLWSTKAWHGMGTAHVAWLGLAVLVLSGAARWDAILAEAAVWDTLVWLGGLLSLADGLREHGVVAWFADAVRTHAEGLSMLPTLLVLALAYFYSMYAFSMLTAHISAMVAAFLLVAATVGAPALLAVPLFAYLSNLCACTTHYSTGPVILYFGLGYVSVRRWFAIGFVVSLVHLAVWLGLGLAWWRLLGWW